MKHFPSLLAFFKKNSKLFGEFWETVEDFWKESCKSFYKNCNCRWKVKLWEEDEYLWKCKWRRVHCSWGWRVKGATVGEVGEACQWLLFTAWGICICRWSPFLSKPQPYPNSLTSTLYFIESELHTQIKTRKINRQTNKHLHKCTIAEMHLHSPIYIIKHIQVMEKFHKLWQTSFKRWTTCKKHQKN